MLSLRCGGRGAPASSSLILRPGQAFVHGLALGRILREKPEGKVSGILEEGGGGGRGGGEVRGEGEVCANLAGWKL